MGKRWEYQGSSLTGSEVYHKGNDILVLYSSRIVRLWKNIQNDETLRQEFVPCFAERCIQRQFKKIKLRTRDLKKYVPGAKVR